MKQLFWSTILVACVGCGPSFVASHVDPEFAEEGMRSGRLALIGFRGTLPASPIASAVDAAFTAALTTRLPAATVVAPAPIEARLGDRLDEAVTGISNGPLTLPDPTVALIDAADPEARYAVAGAILADVTKQQRSETYCSPDEKAKGCKPREIAEAVRCVRLRVRVADIGSGRIGWDSGDIRTCATSSRSREKETGLLGMLAGELAFPAPPDDSEVAEVAASTVVDVLVPRGHDNPGFEEHDGLFFRVSLGGGYGFRTSPDATGDVTLGKEWWISEDWGLGIALRVSVPIPVDETTSLRLTESVGFGVAAALSATFN